jgi:phosphate/sulfate permease
MELTLFHYVVGAIALIMLIWNTVEVGRNDAANIVNAVFGARVMPRNKAVWIAGTAVIIGAMASSPVMETARKGIFDPEALPGINAAISVYIGVYLTNTVLLYSFSAYGMPVSTTACLVFALLGSGFALGGAEAIHWDKSSKVILGIICSIIVSGIAGFLVQRMFRGVVRDDCEDPETIKLHGPWMAGALLTGLVYFLVMKGMKNVAFVKSLKASTFDTLGAPFALLSMGGSLSFNLYADSILGKKDFQKSLCCHGCVGDDRDRRGFWAKRSGQLCFAWIGHLYDPSKRRVGWVCGCALVLAFLLRCPAFHGDDHENSPTRDTCRGEYGESGRSGSLVCTSVVYRRGKMDRPQTWSGSCAGSQTKDNSARQTAALRCLACGCDYLCYRERDRLRLGDGLAGFDDLCRLRCGDFNWLG